MMSSTRNVSSLLPSYNSKAQHDSGSSDLDLLESELLDIALLNSGSSLQDPGLLTLEKEKITAPAAVVPVKEKEQELRDDVTSLQSLLDRHVQFGRKLPLRTPYANPLDFVNINPPSLPLSLEIIGLPKVSRVETQMKLSFRIKNAHARENFFIHLPSDCIAKDKFFTSPENPADSTIPNKHISERTLFLDAFLLCASNSNSNNFKQTYVCNRCVNREKRRASRRKSGLNDNSIWQNNENKRAIIFNSKQLFIISNDGLSDGSSAIDFDLPTRIVCYCRHHKATNGFVILFLLKDHNGDILAKTITEPIMIMDKKNTSNTTTPTSTGNAQVSPMTNDTRSFSSPQSEMNCSSEFPIPSNNKNFIISTKCMLDDNNNNNNNGNNNTATTNNCNNRHFPSPKSSSEDSNHSFSDIHFSNNIDNNFRRSLDSWSSAGFNNSSNPALTTLTSDFSTTSARNTGKRQRSINEPFASTPNSFARLPQNFIDSSKHLSNHSSVSLAFNNKPSIQRVIPAQGSINGGIEVTLLGSKFRQGLIIKFGENIALSSQCWNDSTMVTYLPPSSKPGPVMVTIVEPNEASMRNNSNSSISKSNSVSDMLHSSKYTGDKAIFTYVDDTDRQLIELALQIVGLKMNGKLEDARNIAKRIVGSDSSPSSNTTRPITQNTPTNSYAYMMRDINDEQLIIKVIKSFEENNNLSMINLSMCDVRGRTLLHLASFSNCYSLVSLLIKYGSHLNDQDVFGFTALHMACINGDLRIIRLLLECNVDVMKKSKNGFIAKQFFLMNYSINKARYSNYETSLFDDVLTRLTKNSAVCGDNQPFDRDSSQSSFNSSLFDDDNDTHNDRYKGRSHLPVNSAEPISQLSTRDNNTSFAIMDSDSGYDVSDCESSSDEIALEFFNAHKIKDASFQQNQLQKGAETNVEHDGSLWNRMLNRLNDELPKYEDLFPRISKHGELGIKSVDASLEDPTQMTIDDPQTSSEDDELEALQIGFNTIFSKKQNFQNDKMLLFFWIPLTLVLLLCFTLSKLGKDDDMFHNISKIFQEYLRIGLAKVLLGNERMKTSLKMQLSNFQNNNILNDMRVS
ncbi:SPT23-like protein [Saccharomyces kudriavzevii IFO 1802]|uniref:SPT23-like protein n=1 Tax=Saccharomyces kudriavzevii (strain ATCC MYA-4449 / AS 2.2408 / CBS 8840 / NBRC 1802 / NCYC 2889) TaxID=226230 RepID=J4U3A9_SACK1|nr:SPT23-like protein [Saccharomyces kudriavzevii IFO 1802]